MTQEDAAILWPASHSGRPELTLRGVESLGIQELADVAVARRGGVGRQLRGVAREAVQAVGGARGARGAAQMLQRLRRLQAGRQRADGPRREGGDRQGGLRGTAAAALGAAFAPAGQPAGEQVDSGNIHCSPLSHSDTARRRFRGRCIDRATMSNGKASNTDRIPLRMLLRYRQGCSIHQAPAEQQLLDSAPAANTG